MILWGELWLGQQSLVFQGEDMADVRDLEGGVLVCWGSVSTVWWNKQGQGRRAGEIKAFNDPSKRVPLAVRA